MTKELYPFQEEGVRFLTLHPTHPDFPEVGNSELWRDIAHGQFHKLLADDMGLGKTVQAIAGLNAIDARAIVVVCPASVKIHWARKMVEWSARKQNIFIVQNGKSQIPPGASVIIVNYELVLKDKIHRQLVARGQQNAFCAVILDEAHYLKSIDTQRTKRILGKGSFLEYARYKWLLTGTPVLNRPVELFPMLSTLAPETIKPWNSWKAYGERYCNAHRDKRCGRCGSKIAKEETVCPRCESTRTEEYGLNVTGHSNVIELASRLEGFMLRRKKEDVLTQLPDRIETVVELNVEPPRGVEDVPIATARRLLALAKIPEAIKFIRDLYTSTDKLVIFAHHRDVIQALADALIDYGVVICWGGMTSDEKQTSIDRFITDSHVQAFIAQTAAGGLGIDGLQTVCNHVVFIELDWSPGIMDQAVDRLRRIGQKDTVFTYYLAVPDSLDTAMSDVLESKRTVINQLIKSKGATMSSNEPLQVIAQAMTAIAASLEAVNLSLKALGAEPPSTGKGGKGSKKAESVPDPVPNPPSAPPPAASAPPSGDPDVTQEDVREALGRFIGAEGNPDNHRRIINEVLWPTFGATAFANLDPKHYAAVLAELEKGPSAFAATKTASADLSGV